MFVLNGFEEDEKTSYSSMLGSKPTSCNMDNSAMPSNIQDSMCGSETKADGSIPPLASKRKLNDNVEVSPRTISTSELRKR
jgi:hypothetical protein